MVDFRPSFKITDGDQLFNEETFDESKHYKKHLKTLRANTQLTEMN